MGNIEYLLEEINLKTVKVRKPKHGLANSYALDQAYSGIKLVQHTAEGQRDVSPNGFGTKRELYIFMRGMLETL